MALPVVRPSGRERLRDGLPRSRHGRLHPPETVVLLKRIDPEAIIPGEEYAIVSRKIVTLRIVRAAEQEGKLRLVAVNRANYDDMLVDMNDLDAVYRVNGKLIINY